MEPEGATGSHDGAGLPVFPGLSYFQPLIDETFHFWIENPEENVAGVLTDAKSLSSSRPAGADLAEPFRLDFRFPPGFGERQNLFQLRAPDGRTLPPMFLVARSADDNGWHMDATFN